MQLGLLNRDSIQPVLGPHQVQPIDFRKKTLWRDLEDRLRRWLRCQRRRLRRQGRRRPSHRNLAGRRSCDLRLNPVHPRRRQRRSPRPGLQQHQHRLARPADHLLRHRQVHPQGQALRRLPEEGRRRLLRLRLHRQLQVHRRHHLHPRQQRQRLLAVHRRRLQRRNFHSRPGNRRLFDRRHRHHPHAPPR
jgi:hypothetical protein